MRDSNRRQRYLKDICFEITVGYVGSMSKEYVKNGVPLLRSLNVQSYWLNLNDLKFISVEFHQKISKSSLREGDVVIVRTGLPGTSCVITQGIKELNCSDLVIARPDPSKINPFYLSFYFNSIAKGYVENQLVGAIQQHFNVGSAKEMIIDLPGIDEQGKIVKVLNDINSKIELNNRINGELEAMAKTLYDYWFVQFDFPDHNGKPYKSSGGKMVWNEALKREIPEGWDSGELKDIANITMGQSPPGESYNDKGEGMIFFQGCTDFGNRYPTIRQFTTQPTRYAKEGDILLSVRAPVGTINIAKENCCIGRGLAALNSKDNCVAYLFGVMVNLKQIFDRRNVDGTTFGSITKDDLFSLKVLRPAKEILKRYHETVTPAFEKQNKIELENQQLAELRDWLLPMLMNGQVTVADAAEEVRMRMAAESAVAYGSI